MDTDVDRFSVSILKAWKLDAERVATVDVGKTVGPSDLVANDLLALLKKFSPDMSADFYFREGYETLTNVDPSLNYSVTVEADGVTVTAKSKDGEPISIAFDPVFPDSPEGRQKAAEFQDFLEKGTPVELTSENVPLDSLPAFLRLASPHQGGQVHLRLGPRRPRSMAAALIFKNQAGEFCEFPYIEFATNRFDNHDVVLSNAQQRIPFKVELRLSRDRRGTFNWTFNLAGRGFFWAKEALRLQHVITKPSEVVYRDIDDGTEHLATNVDATGLDVNPLFVSFVDRVLAVQKATGSPIHVPNRSYPLEVDLRTLEFIEFVIATGRRPGLPAEVTLTVGDSSSLVHLRRMIDGEEQFHCETEKYVERFLDDVVPLGPVIIWCNKVAVHPDDVGVLSLLEQGRVDYPQTISIIPSDGFGMSARFLLWDRIPPTAATSPDSRGVRQTMLDKRHGIERENALVKLAPRGLTKR